MTQSIVFHRGWNNDEPWERCHVLEASSVPALEFASALNRLVPTVAWRQRMRWLDLFTGSVKPKTVVDPPASIIDFPLQRSYSHPLMDRIGIFSQKLLHRLLQHCKQPGRCPLICSTPFFASVAEQWPGPVIYYSLDLTWAYEGLNVHQVQQLDVRLCRAAHLVCPVSERIAHYFVEQAGCDPDKIQILPNATRAANIRDSVSCEPDELPPELGDMKRPIAGIIGNMAANLDWELLQSAVERTPEISWAFIGPTSMPIGERKQRHARAAVMKISNRARFTGPQPYSSLQAFARAFDVAVLPYRHREPTYSGSATRFYEHLAACRPILATPHVAELQKKPPLLCLVEEVNQLVSKLHDLRAARFRDGYEKARWLASRKETWDARAETMLSALGSVTRSHACVHVGV